MLHFTKKRYGTEEYCHCDGDEVVDIRKYRKVREGNISARFMQAMLDGGNSGVQMGLTIIPGVLIICTMVLMLTNGAGAGAPTRGGLRGIAFLPWVGAKLNPVLKPLFGFTSPEAIAVPVTALGAAGASIGLILPMIRSGLAVGNDIAVFTAMCMCWSGYLSTHVAMMDSLHCSDMTGKAIFSHTIGGLVAGIAAHWIYVLIVFVTLQWHKDQLKTNKSADARRLCPAPLMGVGQPSCASALFLTLLTVCCPEARCSGERPPGSWSGSAGSCGSGSWRC